MNDKNILTAIAAGLAGLTLGLGGMYVVTSGDGGSSSEACLAALDSADQGFGLAGEGMGYAGDALMAAANMDLTGLTDATDGMESVNNRLGPVGDEYNKQKERCRDNA